MPYTYNRLMSAVKLICTDVRVQRITAGKTSGGREIAALRIGCGRPRLLFVAGHHGREHITTRCAMELCTHLLRNGLPEGFCADFLPMLNPDGVEIAIYRDYTWKANARGVDLNRNYPAGWDALPIGVSSYAGYKGERPFSEPETRALLSLCEKHNYDAAVTLHAYGREIRYADMLSDIPFSLDTARLAAEATGFPILPPTRDPLMLGGFENWFRLRYSRPCLLIEIDAVTCECLKTLPAALFGGLICSGR